MTEVRSRYSPRTDVSATDPTNNARQQRWRDRARGKLDPAPKVECVACGKTHTGARGAHCSKCWELHTVEGKAFRAARNRKYKARLKAERNLEA